MTSETVSISAGTVQLEGDLAIPPGAAGLVIFAHGSGSSRLSPRNRFVAQALREHGLGTLLLDLLTADEEMQDEIDARLRFDIPLLAERLGGATQWARRFPMTRGLAIGYFGASTGAAAALIAAAARPRQVRAVVSRGGRPDLAQAALAEVRTPTLLIVGGDDVPVLALNREACRRMRAPCDLVIIPHATHLFEEPGALQEVAALAAAWFERHLGQARPEETPAPV